MAYELHIADRALVRARYRCQACGVHWSDFPKVEGDHPIDAHSALTFHVFRQDNGLYIASSVPNEYRSLKDRELKLKDYLTGRFGREDDAFCLCGRSIDGVKGGGCHHKVHAIAMALTKQKYPGYAWKHAAPKILEYVTFKFVESGGKWAP